MDRADLTHSYLEAIGVPRSAPTAGLLAEIVRRHVATIPFTSIGPQLDLDLPLDPEALHDRLIARRRGGYCFEQNGLLFEVLQDLGFECRLVLARVLLSGNPHPGLTHRITVVRIDEGDFVVDGGFGAQGPHLPVPMTAEDVGSAWRRFRVVEARPGHWHMQSKSDSDWHSLYRFELLDYGPSDCEVGHFYSHRHPEAVFVTALVSTRILDDEVRSLRNLDYRVITADGSDERRLGSAEDLRVLLEREFGLQVTFPEADRLFARARSQDREEPR